MTGFLENLMAWSAQVCVLTAVAAGAALALKNPRARLWFWQAILALALLLPLMQPKLAPRSAGEVAITTGPAFVAGDSTRSTFVFRREDVLFVIALGIALRLIWIAIGFWRLRRHRLAARVLDDPPFQAPRVGWYISDTVSGPVTFGWLRPSILLPSSVNQLDERLRESIVCHELIHVERRDWLFVVGEEGIRAALWFHPAIWFVLSQIQLAREQTVDAEVVRRTSDRETYLHALLAVAEQRFSPAPLFLRRRQLALRVAAVLKETPMSKARLVARFATVLSAALMAARLAMWFFPMQAPAQTADAANALAGDGPGISVDAGAPLMHRAPVFRGGSTETGTVAVDATVNSKGEVSDARVVSGPDELRKPVLQSVLQWHYSTATALHSPIRISIRFDPAPPRGPIRDPMVQPWPPPPIETLATLKAIEFVGVSPDVQQRVLDALPVHEGDEVTSTSRAQILAAAREIDEHFEARMNFGPNHQATLTLMLGPPFAGQRLPATAQPPQRIRVGGNVQAENLVQKVVPAYPPDAKAARIQGIVRFTATIGKDGSVLGLDLISGHPLLVQAAYQAVKQWQYKPTLLNGQPIEVVTEIDVNFTLSQ